jgi:hypothetical protein
MKRLILFIVALIALTAGRTVLAESLENRNDFGLGFVLGEPSGLNGQFYWSQRSAIDITAAWSWNDWMMVIGDFQVYNNIADSPHNWKWYYGVGAYLALPENDNGTFGVRVPLGLRYRIPQSAVDIWGEVAPALRVVPDTEPVLQGGLGVTFWLK